MINNQYKDKIMSLSDYIKDNKEVYELAIELTEELPNAREKIVNDFFHKITFLLEKKLGSQWKVEIVGNLYKRNLHIYKKSWQNLILAFEFDENNYYDGYFGIVRKNNKVDIEKIKDKFEAKIKAINYKLTATLWWLHWEWLPNIDETVDFAKYIQFDENAEKEFLEGIMKIIKMFELDSNLMTEINSYLNNK
jgi:hypothetical protein